MEGLHIILTDDVLFFFGVEDSLLYGHNCTLSAVSDAEFSEDVFNVGFKGGAADSKLFCYGNILITCDYQVENIFFPVGQAGFRIRGG